jgi:hypothetical protein
MHLDCTKIKNSERNITAPSVLKAQVFYANLTLLSLSLQKEERRLQSKQGEVNPVHGYPTAYREKRRRVRSMPDQYARPNKFKCTSNG